MKITTISAVFLSLLFANIAAADVSFTGTYKLDQDKWKAQVVQSLATHAVNTSLSDQDTLKLVDFICKCFGTINVKEDGSFSMSNEFVIITGSWNEMNGVLTATEKQWKFTTTLPGSVELGVFHLFIKDGAFHYGQDKDGPTDLPLIRLNEPSNK